MVLWSMKELASATVLTFEKNVVTDTADGTYSVYAADVNNDGYMDVLSASFDDDTIAWYANNGNQSFTKHVITTSALAARSQAGHLGGAQQASLQALRRALRPNEYNR